MKRSVVSGLLILFASFVFCLAETEKETPSLSAAIKENSLSENMDIKDLGDNSIDQTGLPESRAKTLPEVGAGWKALSQQAQKETHAWTLKGASGNKGKLAEAVQAQVIAELNFIRKAAVEEGATKTVEAIDRVLETRKERFDNIREKLKIGSQKMSREEGDRATRRGQQRQRGNRQPRRARQSRQRGR